MAKRLQIGEGLQGPAGKSAYEYAQDGGYTGTEEEFAQKLATEYPTDVQIDGTSIVGEDGVAEIPKMTNLIWGISKANAYYGLHTSKSEGLSIARATDSEITGRSNPFHPITPKNVDYAVEKVMGAPIGDGMIDGVFHYPEWSEETQVAARKRMGIGEYELVVDVTISEETQNINIETDMLGNQLNLKQSMIIIHTIGTTSNSGEGSIEITLFKNSALKGLKVGRSRAFRSNPTYVIRQFILTFGDYAIVADTSNNVPMFNVSSALIDDEPFKTLGGIYLSGNTAGSNTFGIGSRVLIYGVRA